MNSCKLSISASVTVAPVGIVRTVHQDQLCVFVRQLFDLVDVDAKLVLFPKSIVAGLDTKRLGECGKRSKTRVGRRTTLAPISAASQNRMSSAFIGAGYDLDILDFNVVHAGDRCA